MTVQSEASLEFSSKKLPPIRGSKVLRLERRISQLEEVVCKLKAMLRQNRKNEAFFELVLDTTPNLIWVKDSRGRFTFVNRALAEAFNLSKAQMLGRRDEELMQDRAQLKSFRRDEQAVLRTQRPLRISQEAFTDARNQIRALATRKVPLRLPNGELQVLGVSTDITELTHARDAIAQVEQMNIAFAWAKAAAHDIRSHLQSILNLVDCLSDKSVGQHPKGYAKCISDLESEVELADSIIQELGNLSEPRLRSAQDVDVNVMLDDCLVSLLPVARESKIRIQRSFATNLPPVIGQRTSLVRAFSNIIKNAIEAMPKGGTLRITSKMTSLPVNSVRQKENEGRVVVRITDSGPGIPAEVLRLIGNFGFTTKAKGRRHMGVGLWTATRLLSLHSANLKVTNNPNSRGCTVEVVFRADRS